MNIKKAFSSSIFAFIIAAVALSLLLISDSGLSGDKEEIDFTFNDLNDKPVKLSDFRGKIVIVDIWSIGCNPCRKEIPGFINLYNKYKDNGIEIIGISRDEGGKKDVAPFAKEYKINYIMLVAGRKEVDNVFGPIRGVPTTFLIDKNGKIVEKYFGFHPEEKFEEDILKLLKNETL